MSTHAGYAAARSKVVPFNVACPHAAVTNRMPTAAKPPAL